MPTKKFIVCHNRDRDSYQVASALEEASALQCLITDYYDGSLGPVFVAMLDRFLGHRKADLVPYSRVNSSLLSMILQFCIQMPGPKPDLMHLSDRILGSNALRASIKNPGADMLLYSTNAFEAFTAKENTEKRKILFFYHPHPAFIEDVLLQDTLRPHDLAPSSQREVRVPHQLERLEAELANADEVICASSTTKQSVLHAGYPDKPISIVPYGADPVRSAYDPSYKRASKETVRFLFVGQAIQRKGLHHLFEAWRQANIPNGELTVVSSSNPDGILDSAPSGVTTLTKLSLAELIKTFQRAHCFVLPALVEGFGLVLLEAARAGCYTIYSDSTGFADLEIGPQMGRCVRRNSIKELQEALVRFNEMHLSNQIDYDFIAQASQDFSTQAFRRGVREVVLGADYELPGEKA